jgi:DNA-binding NtrC family response regulator
MEILSEIRAHDSRLPVIMITAYGTVENAVRAMQCGAANFVQKPWDNEKLLADVRAAVGWRRAEEENVQLKRALKQRYNFENIVGKSEPMLKIFDLVAQVAPSRSTILLQGESGTGKELIAKAIHLNSPRRDRAFVPVNTGSMPPDLLESTLFGHVKGAFTSAIASKKGLFEIADRGTLFLDEIGTMSMDTQSKILRVLQDRKFMHLGGVHEIQADVRIIAATNVDLKREMEDGHFREDLYYRLHVISIELPALRDRRDDVPLLVQHFLEKYAEENGRPPLELAPEALELLMEYDWPGNVRELENVIERAVVLSSGTRIAADRIPEHVRKSPRFQLPHVVMPAEGVSLKEVTAAYERQWIESALEAAGGVQKRAAELLRIKPTTLNEMIKRYDIRPRRKKASSAPAGPGEPGAAAAEENGDELEPVGTDAE